MGNTFWVAKISNIFFFFFFWGGGGVLEFLIYFWNER